MHFKHDNDVMEFRSFSMLLNEHDERSHTAGLQINVFKELIKLRLLL